jgi:hypothetical protein
MTPLERAESFVCPHLHGTIRRGDCAARHERFGTKAGANGITGCCCRRCDVGAEHARDARVEYVQIAVIVPKPNARRRRTRLCLGCGGPILEPRIHRRDRLLDLRRRVCGPACAVLASEYKRRMHANQLPEWAQQEIRT